MRPGSVDFLNDPTCFPGPDTPAATQRKAVRRGRFPRQSLVMNTARAPPVKRKPYRAIEVPIDRSGITSWYLDLYQVSRARADTALFILLLRQCAPAHRAGDQRIEQPVPVDATAEPAFYGPVLRPCETVELREQMVAHGPQEPVHMKQGIALEPERTTMAHETSVRAGAERFVFLSWADVRSIGPVDICAPHLRRP